MGNVRLTHEDNHARWVIDCGEAGARLRVVVKESVSSAGPSSSSLPANSSRSVGHCYTLRPAIATDPDCIDSGWNNEIAPAWANAWASGRLSPLQKSLVPRIAGGGLLMMDAARTQAQAMEAVLHAPLDQVRSFCLRRFASHIGGCVPFDLIKARVLHLDGNSTPRHRSLPSTQVT